MQMLLTGEPITAEQAMDWGLVNRVVPADQLDEAVDDLANKILRFSPRTIATGKQAYYAQAELPETAAYEITEPIMADNAAREDAQEGMSAFIEKRRPVWPDRS
jgi:enoyl-CoA hydratase/carnithine racemase